MKTKRLLALAFTMLLITTACATQIPPNDEEEENRWTPEETAKIRSSQSPIPLQAAVCDIVGVGVVTDISTNQWGDIVQLAVNNYWIGNPGSNTLNVSANRSALTVTNTPIVFFATRYVLPRVPFISESRFSFLFKMPEYRQNRQPREPWFYDNERSWFYATPENAELVTFASNLVNTAQISTNRLAYYELVRDGFRLNPPESRIHIDSEVTVLNSLRWMPTNFMIQVWSDALLPNSLRAHINNNYMLKTGHWLP